MYTWFELAPPITQTSPTLFVVPYEQSQQQLKFTGNAMHNGDCALTATIDFSVPPIGFYCNGRLHEST